MIINKTMAKSRVYCISGIDTDIGKTIVTGLLAGSCLQQGIRTITQKIVQTGCIGLSEDIIRHRELMGIELQPVDFTGLTCPYVLPVPALRIWLPNWKIELLIAMSFERQLHRFLSSSTWSFLKELAAFMYR